MSSVVPEGWRARLFGDLAKVINGYAFKGSDFVEKSETSVPIIRMSSLKAGTIDLSDAVYVAKNNVKGLEKFLLNSGDFVFGMSGSISNFAIIKEKDGICYQNQRVGRLSPINASSGFLSQLFLSESVSRQIEGLAAGGAQLNISSSQIENLNILSPPLPEQKKIASILTSVDEVIENTQKQIDKLQDLKKATMNELLTKGIGHTEFKDSELGRIPKSWEVNKLENFSDFITKGATPTTYGFDWQKTGILFLKSESVKRGEFTKSGSMRICEDAHNAMNRSKINGGDILVSITGYIGHACIFPHQYGEANINQHIARVRIDNNKMSEFVMYFLNSETQYQRYLSIQTGQAYPQLSLQQIRKTCIPIPPLSEMVEIVSILSSIDKTIEGKKQKIQQTQSLKKSLMQDLLTGKVRVTVN
ncbi:restriction endonuclease subunit S [Gammaproteobacteria bacterium]|nr:restriction endonuclease subunit S [Gammaproteobacteria bacterium]